MSTKLLLLLKPYGCNLTLLLLVIFFAYLQDTIFGKKEKKNEREIRVAQPILTAAAACMKIRVVVKFQCSGNTRNCAKNDFNFFQYLMSAIKLQAALLEPVESIVYQEGGIENALTTFCAVLRRRPCLLRSREKWQCQRHQRWKSAITEANRSLRHICNVITLVIPLSSFSLLLLFFCLSSLTRKFEGGTHPQKKSWHLTATLSITMYSIVTIIVGLKKITLLNSVSDFSRQV